MGLLLTACSPLRDLSARGASRRVLVIIPAWNEEKSVAGVIAEVRAALPSVDVVVVDDGSTDATRRRARASGATVLSLPLHLGVGGAMRTGYRYALRRGYDVAVQVDADGQHDPFQAAALVDAVVAGADLAIGARFAGAGDYAVRGPRRWAMTIMASWLSRRLHTHLTDVTSGFRAANRTTIELFAAHYPAEYLGDTVEALVMAGRAGLTVVQVPVRMRARVHGAPSQSPWRAGLYLLRAVMAIALASGRDWPRTSIPDSQESRATYE